MGVWRWVGWTLCLLMVRGTPGSGQETCSQCDCKLSSNEDERAIFNLKSTMCRAGSLQWISAYGAIRLEIQPFQHHSYRLCFVVHGQHTLTQVSLEDPLLLPKAKNYRLQTSEAVRSRAMRRLVSTGGRSEEVCVVGGARQSLLLFLEVQRTHEFTGIPSVSLQYDVEPLPSVEAVLADPMEECRPCTQDELLEAYCTSDFVAVGSILQTRQAEDQEDATHMEVAVAQLIHQNAPVFSRLRRQDRHLQGVIHAPSRCGIRPGKGDFLFTGRMRLGKAKLRCAPYFEDWLKMSSLAECGYD